jgi:hypothetical protein
MLTHSICRALNNVANHQSMCKFLDIIFTGPAVPPHSSANSNGGIRNATANNDVCTTFETLCDTGSTEVALSADGIETPILYVLVGR